MKLKTKFISCMLAFLLCVISVCPNFPVFADDMYTDYLKYLMNTQQGQNTTPIQAAHNIPAAPSTGENIENHWAVEAINNCYAAGMINMSAGGKIRPDDPILRGELAFAFSKWLIKNKEYLDSMDFDRSRGPVYLADVSASDVFYQEITELSEMGIINGYTNIFGAGDKLTREQLCTVFLNFLLKLRKGYVNNEYLSHLNVNSYLNGYNDYFLVSPWARQGVAALTEQNYITGYVDGTFRPQGQVTRAEAYQIFNLAEKMMAGYHFYNNTVTYEPNEDILAYYKENGYYKTMEDYYGDYYDDNYLKTPENEELLSSSPVIMSYKVKEITSKGFEFHFFVNFSAYDNPDTTLVYGYSTKEIKQMSQSRIDNPPDNIDSFEDYRYRTIKLENIDKTYGYNKRNEEGCGFIADIEVYDPGTYYFYFMLKNKDETSYIERKRVIVPDSD